tara:strand:+ start:564 stop:878 length:315 start_codon:yes stop_codon:yes gene_type:complete
MTKEKKYQSEYYLKNKEAKKTYNRESYIKNRDKRLTEARAKRQARTPEQIELDKKKASEYYEKNAAILREKRKNMSKELKDRLVEREKEIHLLKDQLKKYTTEE